MYHMIYQLQTNLCANQRLTHQAHMDGKFHTYADRSNEDDHRYGAKLDANQPHHAE